MTIIYMKGCEGNSFYLNDYRIAGPKPWGDGEVVEELQVGIEDIVTAIGREQLKDFLNEDLPD